MGLCKQAISATPTPAALTGAESFIFTKPVSADKPCSGIGDVSGVVRDALARPIAGAAVGYSTDGINLTTVRTNANGQYQLIWGKDPGLFHVVVLDADGKAPVGVSADVQYVGGNNAGCHVVIDWQRVQ
jgi:hypothetical protein